MPSVSLPAVMLAVGMAGAGVAAAGSVEAGQARSTSAAYQAQVAANNAAIAKANATLEIQSGEAAATAHGLKTRAVVGSQKALQGAGGINVNSGSAADVRAGTEEMGMLDALTIRSNSARRAYGYQVTGVSETAQSQLDVMEASQAKEAGDISGAASLLQGASTVGTNYARMQNLGVT